MATASTPRPQSIIPAETKSQKFDLAISLTLHTWHILSVAVSNSWGGPDSVTKRDWLAGAVSDFLSGALPPFTSSPPTVSSSTPSSTTPGVGALDAAAMHEVQEDLEVVLLQVMEDEFGVRVEDESEVDVARGILRLWRECAAGRFDEVDGLMRAWEEREERRRAAGGVVAPVEVREVEVEGDSDEVDDDDDDDDEGDDVQMGEAPSLVKLAPVKEKTEPEVDEDGFTKVVGKKKR